jgi:hypothetical protein
VEKLHLRVKGNYAQIQFLHALIYATSCFPANFINALGYATLVTVSHAKKQLNKNVGVIGPSGKYFVI